MGDNPSLAIEDFDSEALIWLAAYDPATMLNITKICKQNGRLLFYDPGQQVVNISTAYNLARA